MGSSTVKAQRLANEANIQMNAENNELQRQLAKEANELNYQMFNEQNEWNLDRRNEEWEYNDPSAQMQRLIKAGINPIVAAGNITAGQAQQLTSASAQPAEVAHTTPGHVMPEDGMARDLSVLNQGLGNLNASANNLINGYVAVKSLNQSLRESDSRISLNEYEALLKGTQTEQLRIANEQNVTTFGTRVELLQQNLSYLRAQTSSVEQGTANAKALHNNIVAQEDLIRSAIQVNQKQIDKMSADIVQGWRALDIQQQNADTSSGALRLSGQQFDFDKQKYENELIKMNNDEIFRWLDRFSPRRSTSGKLSVDTRIGPFGVDAGASITNSNEANTAMGLAAMSAAGVTMYKRAIDNPTEQNVKDYNKMQSMIVDYMDRIQTLPQDDFNINRTPPSWNVLNPSGF